MIFIFLSNSFLSNAQEEENIVTVESDTSIVEPIFEEETEVIVSSKKKYFHSRFDTLTVTQRSIPSGVVNRMKEDEDFWYANSDIKQKKSKEQIAYEKELGEKGKKGKQEQAIKEDQQRNNYVPLGQRTWFQTLLWVVILGVFVVGLIIYLGGSNVGLFRKKNVGTSETGEEEITEDIFAINYQKEIDKAAAEGNYRLAIRLMFLRVLKNMSEKNIIRYKQDKTNLDYLLELQSSNHYNNFFRITRNYEYSWYGQFNVSEEAFKIIRNDFNQFEKVLR